MCPWTACHGLHWWPLDGELRVGLGGAHGYMPYEHVPTNGAHGVQVILRTWPASPLCSDPTLLRSAPVGRVVIDLLIAAQKPQL